MVTRRFLTSAWQNWSRRQSGALVLREWTVKSQPSDCRNAPHLVQSWGRLVTCPRNKQKQRHLISVQTSFRLAASSTKQLQVGSHLPVTQWSILCTRSFMRRRRPLLTTTQTHLRNCSASFVGASPKNQRRDISRFAT